MGLTLFGRIWLPILRASFHPFASQSLSKSLSLPTEYPPMQSLQVVYRATVMLGSLVVGALAYRAYGPELEQLKPVVARIQELASEAWSPGAATDDLTADTALPAPPANFTASTDVAPLSAPPLVDRNVQPTATWSHDSVEAAPSQPVDQSPVAGVIRQLNARGVTQYSLNPWGQGDEFYRFRCSAPWGSEGRYSRQFEAIASDPAEAAQQVLHQIEQWHATNGG